MQQTTTKLDIQSPNHIKYRYDKLTFDILGGVNPENYQSLRVMLVTKNDRKAHRDHVDLNASEQVTSYIQKASEVTSIHRDAIRTAISELTYELEEYKLELQTAKSKPVVKSHQLSDSDHQEAIDFLKKPRLLSRLNELMDEAGIIGNRLNRMVLFLTFLTRKTNSCLHAVIQSQYNYLQGKLSAIIPEEEQIQISHISENALFYFNEEELMNKVILIEDTITNRKHLAPILGFQNGTHVTKTTVTKNDFAELVTIQKKVNGNLSLSISTKDEQAFNQIGRLSFILSEDSGKEFEDEVLLYQRKQSAGLVNQYQEIIAAKQIQNFQRVLSPVSVINPFAMNIELPQQIQNKQVTNLHYLRFLEVITFLNQFQRNRKVNEDTGEEYIETTLEDIKEGNELLTEILIRKSDGLSKTVKDCLNETKNALESGRLSSEGFTLRELSIALISSKSTVARNVKALVKAGFMVATGEGDVKNGEIYKLVNQNYYAELRTNIQKELSKSVLRIEKSLSGGSCEPLAHQTHFEALNELNYSKLDDEVQSSEGVLGKAGKTKKNTGRKAV